MIISAYAGGLISESILLIDYTNPVLEIRIAELEPLVEYTELARGIYISEQSYLVEYIGSAITYTADLPSIAECIALVEYYFDSIAVDFAEEIVIVEYTVYNKDLNFAELSVLVEYTEVPGGIWVGEIIYLLEYIGSDITYTPDLFSDGEVTYLLEFTSYVVTRPIIVQSIYGPILWIM